VEVLAFCLVLQDYSHISGRIRWHCLASGSSSFIVRQEELIIGKTAELFWGASRGASDKPRVLFGRQEGQGQVFGGGGAAARGFFEGGVAAVEGLFGLLAVKNLLNGEDLQARVGGAVGGFVQAGFGGRTQAQARL